VVAEGPEAPAAAVAHIRQFQTSTLRRVLQSQFLLVQPEAVYQPVPQEPAGILGSHLPEPY
jgi:hypothetical protein